MSKDQKSAQKPIRPKDAKTVVELLFADYESNDLSQQTFVQCLNPFDLDRLAGTNRFFAAASRAGKEEQWKALTEKEFSTHPLPRKKYDEKAGDDRLETYKEVYRRIYAVFREVGKELAKPKPRPGDVKAVAARQQRLYQLFGDIVENGFDKFDKYFPNLRPANINLVLEPLEPANAFLHKAAVYGHTEFVRKILQWGGWVDIRAVGSFHSGAGGPPMFSPNLGNTPLIFAASHGHLDCVTLLVMSGANVNHVTADYNTTALHQAAAHGHVGCVRFLLDQNARTDVRNKHFEQRPLEAACDEECRALIIAKMRERNESTDSPGCVIL